jgi:(R,R)-butanediol dehydrogenase/meso-butanediol dehydrogenase/diacetyl reductase
MRAAVYHGTGDVRIEERPAPAPGDDELLLRVATAGICGTDVGEYVHGPQQFPLDRADPFSGHAGPIVPGHEFSGHVVAAGPDTAGFAEGDLVAVGAGVSCGRCAPCARGATNLCERYWTVGLQRDGGLAELVAVPASACLRVAGRGIGPDVIALSQPMSIALHAVRRGGPAPGQAVTVLGTGGIGAFLTSAAAHLGAEVTAVDVDPDRLAVAAALGAARAVAVSRAEPLVDQLRDAVGSPGLLFECTGTPQGLDAAILATARGGRVVVVGHQPAPLAVDFKLVSYGERELVGTVAHVFARDFADAVDLVGADPDRWTHVAPTVRPLDLLVDGLDALAGGRPPQIKSLFDPSITAPRPLQVRPEPGA